jgi:hypothetical protein
MKTNFDDYEIERMVKTVKCFKITANIQIINLLEQKESLRSNEIVSLLKEKNSWIAEQLYKLVDQKIVLKEYKNNKRYYRLNKELIEKVLDFSKSLG